MKHDNFLSLLEFNNYQAYYNKIPEKRDFIGIEIRFNENFECNEIEEVLNLLREIRVEKQKILKSENNE